MKKLMVISAFLVISALTACGNHPQAGPPSPEPTPDASAVQTAEPSSSVDIPDPSPSLSGDPNVVTSDPGNETQDPDPGTEGPPESTPAASPVVTLTPTPSTTPVATPVPVVTSTPAPTATPVVTLPPAATPTAVVTPTPVVTPEPTPTLTPAPTPTPAPTTTVEVIDTAALEEYARQYARNTYGYDGNPNCGFNSNAGYFPPSTWTIPNMEEGYRIARESIDAQYAHDTGVGQPISVVIDGVTVRLMINMYFQPTDNPNVFLVYRFYGGDAV